MCVRVRVALAAVAAASKSLYDLEEAVYVLLILDLSESGA